MLWQLLPFGHRMRRKTGWIKGGRVNWNKCFIADKGELQLEEDSREISGIVL